MGLPLQNGAITITSDKEKIIHSIYRNAQTCLIKKLIAYWGFAEPKVQFSY